MARLLRADGIFAATTVLAKHDENYMPREVVEALKKSGHWQEGSPSPQPSSGMRGEGGTRGAGG